MRHLLLGFLLLATSGTAAAAPNIAGDWVTEDRTAIVAIAPCGDKICGSVARILVNRPGQPTTDIKNPDPALRKRPFIGLRIISGMSAKGNRWEGGRIYDPNNGRSYKSHLTLNADGSLKVSGCIAIICRSQRWTRAR
jgi:uncharacterized protein (DUF2147 family)